MKFIYLRFFLSKVVTTNSLFGDDEEYKGLSREQYLKLVFSRRIDFEHRSKRFVLFRSQGRRESLMNIFLAELESSISLSITRGQTKNLLMVKTFVGSLPILF